LILTKKLKSKDGNVNWSEWNSMEVFGRWRALPDKLYTSIGDFTVKLKKISIPGITITSSPSNFSKI
jgi:hypothetical protein